jgi:hypothetical protein
MVRKTVGDETRSGSLTAATVTGITNSLNEQSGLTYTFVLTDAGKLVSATNASMATLTIPPNSSVAFAVGSAIAVVSYGATTCTVAAGAGVTLNSTGGAGADVVIDGQYAGVTLYKIGTNTWLAVGAIQ